MISVILIRWIVIYPVDSVIQRLNNRGLLFVFYLFIIHVFFFSLVIPQAIKTKRPAASWAQLLEAWLALILPALILLEAWLALILPAAASRIS